MSNLNPPIPIRPSDLTTYARIRNAALEGFASRGIGSTSIRDVAAAAGVSPGLVQHHFGNKAGLRDAVNEYVIAVAAERFREALQDRPGTGDWARLADTTTIWVQENAVAIRYIARALVEGDPEAAKVFDAFVQIARTNWLMPMADAGIIRPETDVEWAALHSAVYILACVLWEPAINPHLPAPFLAPEQLRRWIDATTTMVRDGISSTSTDRSSKGRGR